MYVPDSVYEQERPHFEEAFSNLEHSVVNERWGRIRYVHSHVDALFDGWVKGRNDLRMKIKL